MIGKEGNHPQHNMSMGLQEAPHPQVETAELVFEAGIGPFGGSAFLVPQGRGRVAGDPLAPAGFTSMIGRWPNV